MIRTRSFRLALLFAFAALTGCASTPPPVRPQLKLDPSADIPYLGRESLAGQVAYFTEWNEARDGRGDWQTDTRRVTVRLDRRSRVVLIADQVHSGSKEEFSYQDLDRYPEQRQWMGTTTVYERDAHGNLLQLKSGARVEVHDFGHAGNGDLLEYYTAEDGRRIERVYDGAGRLIREQVRGADLARPIAEYEYGTPDWDVAEYRFTEGGARYLARAVRLLGRGQPARELRVEMLDGQEAAIRSLFEYQYDRYGNWTRRERFQAGPDWRKGLLVEISHRSFAYYQ